MTLGSDRVRDWMTPDPASVREDASALEAFGQMVERDIRHLPVTDAEGRVIGLLSIDDLRGALPFDVDRKRPLDPLERGEASEYGVGDAMTWEPLTVGAGDSLAEAARCLAEHRIGCLPVVDESGRLQGILSETDALRALALGSESGALEPAQSAASHGADSLVDRLWAERERLVERMAEWEGRGLERSAEGLRTRAARRVRAIERGLARAERGCFGICERCEGRISATPPPGPPGGDAVRRLCPHDSARGWGGLSARLSRRAPGA